MTYRKPSKAFQTRYKMAKDYREAVKEDIREALGFIAPGRIDGFDYRPSASERPDSDRETYTSLPEDLASDFAADIVTYFTPSEAEWSEYEVMTPVPEDQVAAVKAIVDEREAKIRDMLLSSNYYDIAPQIAFEANHGTVGMWVDQGHMSQPIFIEPVPPHELLITPGRMGYIDRFREHYILSDHIEATFASWGSDVDLSDVSIQRLMDKPGQHVKLCWGFWLDWADPGNPVWKCEITVEGKCITPEEIDLGPKEGSCPLLVGRFNPQHWTPWGRGPALKALPDMRVYNEVDERTLEGLDQALSNTIIYPDDSRLDFSEGIEIGRAYPAGRDFDRNKVWELARGVNLDVGLFSKQDMEERLRACFYQDGPRQRGETPPTATQWLDERRRTQQRLGKPSAPLWSELFLPLIQRVERIAVQMGEIDAELTHDQTIIAVKPVSPLQKAQNQDKVAVSRSNLELAAGMFGEALTQVINPIQTMKNIITTSGDELTAVAEEQDAPDGQSG